MKLLPEAPENQLSSPSRLQALTCNVFISSSEVAFSSFNSSGQIIYINRNVEEAGATIDYRCKLMQVTCERTTEQHNRHQVDIAHWMNGVELELPTKLNDMQIQRRKSDHFDLSEHRGQQKCLYPHNVVLHCPSSAARDSSDGRALSGDRKTAH